MESEYWVGQDVEQNDTEVVLLIHGTAAGDPADCGEKWWQRRSDFWQEMDRILGQTAQCGPVEGPVFHWDLGPNSEKQRREAGRQLHQWLSQIDEIGRPYHLICHSHGGSILWHAFTESIKRDRTLSNMASWTTVGTPFLRFAADWRQIILILPVLIGVLALGLSADQMWNLVALWETMVEEGQMASAIALVGMWALALAVLVFSASSVARLFYAWVSERRLSKLGETAWRAYGERWQGLWSDQDEAINGLSGTLALNGDIVPRTMGWNGTTAERLRSRITTPLRWIHNRLLAPLVDQFIWDRIAKRLQGTDIAAVRLVEVGTSPIPTVECEILPEVINQQIYDLANRESAATLAAVRQALSEQSTKPDLPGFLGAVHRGLSWNELIHNSYFDVQGVRELLKARILNEGPARRQTYFAVAQQQPISPSGGSVLLPAALAVALAFVASGTVLVASTLFDNSVATFSDEYQIKQAIAQVPLAQALESSGGNDEALRAWVSALMEAGFETEAIETTRQFPAALGTLSAKLLQQERGDVLHDLIKQSTFAAPEVDCHLSGAVGILLPEEPEMARNVIDILAQRQKAGIDKSADCFGEVSGFDSTRHVSSPSDALGYARYLLARSEARRGAAAEDVRDLSKAIESEQDQSSAFSESIEEYVDRGEVDKAFTLYQALPEEIFVPATTLLKLAGALDKSGMVSDASAVSSTAINVLSRHRQQTESEVLSALSNAGAKTVAFELAEKAQDDALWAIVARGLADFGDSIGAGEAADKSGKFRNGVYKNLVETALEKKDLELGRELYLKIDNKVEADTLFANNIAEKFAELGAADDAILAAEDSQNKWNYRMVIERLEDPLAKAKAARGLAKLLEGASPGDQISYYPVVLDALAMKSKTDEVREIANQIVQNARIYSAAGNWSRLDNSFEAVTMSLCNAGFITEATTVFTMVTSAEGTIGFNVAEANLVRCLSRAGRIKDALSILDVQSDPGAFSGLGEDLPLSSGENGRKIVSTLIDRKRISDAILYLVRSDKHDAAQNLLAELTEQQRSDVLGLIATYAIRNGDTQGAILWADLLVNPEDRDQLLEEMAANSGQNGKCEASRIAARKILDPNKRLSALLECSVSYERLAVLDEAVASARKILDQVDQMRSLAKLAIGYAKHNSFRKALLTCASCLAVLKLDVYTALLESYAKSRK